MKNKKTNKTNKKAQIFALGLVLIMLIAMGYALYTFVMIKGDIETSIEPPAKLIDAYNTQTKLLFYAKESAGLAAQHSFNFIAKEKAARATNGNCIIDGSGYVGWSDKCKPNTENIEENFLLEFKKVYSGFMQDCPEKVNYDATLEKDKINLMAESMTLEVAEKEYNASFTFEPSFSFDISSFGIGLADFESIYSAANGCKSKNGKNATKMKNCIAEKIKNWHIDVEFKDSNLLFNLTTKQNFFFDEGFSVIKLKFKIEA